MSSFNREICHLDAKTGVVIEIQFKVLHRELRFLPVDVVQPFRVVFLIFFKPEDFLDSSSFQVDQRC